MGPCRLLKTIFAQFLGKYRVVSALFGKIERLTFTGTFDAFQHLVKSHSFKQICFPHCSEMGVLKSFLRRRESGSTEVPPIRPHLAGLIARPVFRPGTTSSPQGDDEQMFCHSKRLFIKVSPLRIPAGSAYTARRPVDILRQCWKGFSACNTAPTSQSF